MPAYASSPSYPPPYQHPYNSQFAATEERKKKKGRVLAITQSQDSLIMAATLSSSSVWAKPGAWALDSEEHEDELKQQIPSQPATDFPSLATAAAAKPKKKSKPQTLSLAEFSNYKPQASSAADTRRLTQDELLMLPTGPRERTADELDRSRLGGGFRNYGDSGRVRGPERNREERDLGPSRADEVDDWSKTKKFGSFNAGGSDRGDRREKVGFFNSSRADEVDNWASGKSWAPPSGGVDGGRRERRMGFDSSYLNGSGSDSDNWGRKKEERAPDSETWGRKRENGDGRPRLNLQPRTLPVAVVGNNGQGQEGGKGKGSNPFGEARPREEVLADKGKDWKEIDEQLEALKMKDVSSGGGNRGEGFSRRRGFGIVRSDSVDDKTVKSWRKAETNDASAEEIGKIAEVTEDSSTNTDNVLEEN